MDWQIEKLNMALLPISLAFLYLGDCNTQNYSSTCWHDRDSCKIQPAHPSIIYTVYWKLDAFCCNSLTFSTLTPVLCRGTGFFGVGTLGGGRWGTGTAPACDPWNDADFVMLGGASGLEEAWVLVGTGFTASSCTPEKQNQIWHLSLTRT